MQDRGRPPAPELAAAASLIDAMTAPFDPAAHHDRYRAELADLVQAKVSGRRPGRRAGLPGR